MESRTCKTTDLSERQVRKMMDQLRADERLTRKGGKTGEWIIIDK